MEAMSSGTAVIVTNIPVFEKHELKNQLFTIVPVGDSQLIANAINDFLSNNSIRNSRKKIIISYAQDNLDWNVIAINYKTLLNKLTI